METKNKKIIITLSILLFLFVAYSVFLMYGLYIKDLNYLTSDVIDGNVAYRYDKDLDAYIVSGFGKLESNNPRHLTKQEAIIVIESKIKGKTVVEIKDYAFSETHIREVTIPSSVKRIGEAAFSSSGLEKVILNEGLVEIDDYAFLHCHSLNEIEFPSTLRKIGYQAFSNVALEELSLNNVELGVRAFEECYNLNRITFEGKIAIEEFTFDHNGISYLDLTNVTSVGMYAFSNNVIRAVYIPKELYYYDYDIHDYVNKIHKTTFFQVVDVYIEEELFFDFNFNFVNVHTGVSRTEYYEMINQ